MSPRKYLIHLKVLRLKEYSVPQKIMVSFQCDTQHALKSIKSHLPWIKKIVRCVSKFSISAEEYHLFPK